MPKGVAKYEHLFNKPTSVLLYKSSVIAAAFAVTKSIAHIDINLVTNSCVA